MNQKKKIISVVMIATILMLCLSGCGVTKEKLLTQVGKGMLTAKSYSINTVMDVDMSGEVMGAKMTAGISVDMNTDVYVTPFIGYGKGTMTVEAMGQEQKLDIELYEEIAEKQLTVLAKINDSDWQKQVSEIEDDNFKVLGLAGLAKLGDLLELEKDTATMNGEECYVIKGQIDGETLQQIIDLAMGAGQAKDLMEGVDWHGRQVPAELYVAKKGKHLVKMSFDLIGVMDAAVESGMGEFGGLVKTEKCIFDVSFSNYNKVEQIVIPDDVRASAKEE